MDGIGATAARENRAINNQPVIAVIGAGIAGILMGVKLRERGFKSFTIYEKAATLGGVWRDNRYPGLTCDVPAHLYRYSFKGNPNWKQHFATAPDIWNYYNRVAHEYDVTEHIVYNREVSAADWLGDKWKLQLSNGEIVEADIVVSCTGRLHHINTPQIPGLDDFAGPKFHTARWPADLNLTGKRVGVIGAGSTASQIIGALPDRVKKLVAFQRTPQWVLRLENPKTSLLKRILYRIFPKRMEAHAQELKRGLKQHLQMIISDDTAARYAALRPSLELIKDPDLRARLTPNYEPGCKRLVMSPTYHEAVQKPNVEIVIGEIERIEPGGVRTPDGKLHELDILVLATGFKAKSFMRPMQIRGENGVTLEQLWSDDFICYHSTALPHMPNFFMINGPYSPEASTVVVTLIEVYVDYVLKCIDRIASQNITMAPRMDRTLALLEAVRTKVSKTVWASGCDSWYLGKDGIPIFNPILIDELAEELETPEFSDFNEVAR